MNGIVLILGERKDFEGKRILKGGEKKFEESGEEEEEEEYGCDQESSMSWRKDLGYKEKRWEHAANVGMLK